VQITRQTEYAVRVMLELSRLPKGEMLSARDISERQQVPEVFLKKTIQILARAGLVHTQRGPRGGVQLAKDPAEITLADILVAVEGPVALNLCLAPGYECVNKPDCKVHRVLAKAQKALVSELSAQSLADLARV